MTNEEFTLKLLTDFLVAQKEAIDDVLDRIKKAKGVSDWDPTEITWQQAEGSKGLYEKATPQDNQNFRALLSDLQAHNGTLTRDGWFYWKFSETDSVGRKQRR